MNPIHYRAPECINSTRMRPENLLCRETPLYMRFQKHVERISGSKVIKKCKTITNFSCWRLSRSLRVNSVLTDRQVYIVT